MLAWYHIINSKLAAKQNYARNLTIKRIDFKESVFNLVNEIGKHGIPISSRGPIDSDFLRLVDFKTRVEVKGQKIKVGDALTNYLSLNRTNHIIWTATTCAQNKDLASVQCKGQEKTAAKSK